MSACGILNVDAGSVRRSHSDPPTTVSGPPSSGATITHSPSAAAGGGAAAMTSVARIDAISIRGTSVSFRGEMRMRTRRAILIGAVIAATIASAAARRPAGAQPAAPVADMVLVNGTVLTVDATDSVAEAIAITGGRIVAVGTTAQIRLRAGSATQVIDLRGRTVTPGLIDTHVHFSEAEVLFNVNLSDADVRKIEDVLARVRDRVAKSKPGDWIRGSGWDEGKLAERRYVTAADLDTVSPNNPVWLMQ